MSPSYEEPNLPLGKILFFGSLAILAFIALLGSWDTVGPGQRGILVRAGNPHEQVLTEGFHLKLPLIDTIVPMDVSSQKYETVASAASKDLQVVSTQIAVNYHLVPESVPIVYTTMGLSYQDKIIQPAVQESVKAITAQYAADELITKRGDVKEKILASLRERLTVRNIFLEEVSITDFDFSEGFNQAIELKVKAEQEALTARNQLDRIKIEAEQKVSQAQAQADSQLAIARAEAEGKLAIAQSEAEALRLQRQAITPELVQLRAIEKWDGHLPPYNLGGSGSFGTFLHLDGDKLVAASQGGSR